TISQLIERHVFAIAATNDRVPEPYLRLCASLVDVWVMLIHRLPVGHATAHTADTVGMLGPAVHRAGLHPQRDAPIRARLLTDALAHDRKQRRDSLGGAVAHHPIDPLALVRRVADD